MTAEWSTRMAGSGDLLGGRYRLGAVTGEGAMAQVFRATDTQLDRIVAVKIFRPGTASSADRARRESEKKLLASLSHPALVTLFDAHVSDDGVSYLVMENIDGGTLASRLQEGAVAPADAASLVADLGEALLVVHRAGIIHRDIKPSNILLRPPLTAEHSFRAVLADFGIAHLVDTTRVTAPGMAVGTAAYIAPEQVRGAEPTSASDVYSLGLVLIEVLTGRRAFAQQSPQEAIAARLSVPPDIPDEFGYAWRSLLTVMTSLDPSNRPSALEVADRGRELDGDDAEPDVTAVAIPRSGSAPATVGIPSNDGPGAPFTAATAILPRDEAVPAARPVEADRRAGRRRAPAAVLTASLAGAAAVIVALALWSASTSGSDLLPALPPTPTPSVSPTPVAPAPAIQPAEDTTIAPVPAEEAPQDDDDADEGTAVDDGGGNGGNGNGNSGNGNTGNGNTGNGNSGNGNSGNGNSGNGNGNGEG